MSNLSSQVSGFVHSSPSLLPGLMSELPDIKKWFSSYTYESPVLGSNEDFCISPKGDDGECVDKELYVEDSDEEEKKSVNIRMSRDAQQSILGGMARKSDDEARQHLHDNASDVEVPAYSDSLLLPSEPPDIENWFPSYIYESPELDSADFEISLLGDYTNGENGKFEKGKGDDLVQSTAARAEVGLTCFMDTSSNSCAKSATSAPSENHLCYSAAQNVQQHGSEESNLSDGNSMSSYVNSDSSTRGAALADCSNISNNSVVRSRNKACNVTPIVKEVEVQQTNNIDLISSAKASNLMAFSEACENKMEKESNVNQSDSGWVLMKHKSRGTFFKNIRKDEERAVCTINEVKSMTKNILPHVNDENSLDKLALRKCKADRNTKSTAEDKRAGIVTTEVLKESTNSRYSPALESSGKWRCPQKNKPSTRPPLKQLRLERWVHPK